MNPSQNKVCSVIVSYNSPEELKKCIESCINQVDKIVVVDNSTNLDVKNDISRFIDSTRVELIVNNKNIGLGAALNEGIIYSLEHKYDWTLLLDQDSVLSNEMVAKMIDSYERLSSNHKEQTAVLVPLIYNVQKKKEIPPIITTSLLNRRIKRPDRDLFIHFQITSGSLLKNDAIRKIGLMNELFFIDYIDYDFCFRVINDNYKILLSSTAKLQHSLGEIKYKYHCTYLEHNPTRVYYQTRNRLSVIHKHWRAHKSFVYTEILRFFLKLIKILLLESSKRDKYMAIIKGVFDFIKCRQQLMFS